MIRLAKLVSNLSGGGAVALGLVCLIAAGLAQGGRYSARLDVPSHFAPVWLLGAAATLGYGLIFASPSFRMATLGLGVLGVLAAAALMAPELTRPIRPVVASDAPRQLKLIQFNVWDENRDVQATADWIAAQKPDLVLMEEVEAPIRQAMVQRGFHYLRGMARTAMFSRLQPTYAPFQIPKQDWPILPDFARATFPSPGGAFSVVAVHLDWPTSRIQPGQLTSLAEILDFYPTDRLILAGDFNLTPWSFALRNLDRRLGMERRDRALFSWPARLSSRHRWTWPLPALPIDHIYAGSAWRTVSIERGPRLGSDHYPLIARLALAD